MPTLVYIKNLILIALLFAIALFVYPILSDNYPLELHYKDYTLYTTQSAFVIAISVLSVISFFILRFVYILFARVFFLKDLFLAAKNFFGSFKKSEKNILDKVTNLRRQQKFKEALKITEDNYANSDEILFQHLFLLLKLHKNQRFLKVFEKHQCGKAIHLFNTLTNTWPKWRKILLIRKLHKQNNNNDVFTYLYAEYLIDNKEYDKAYRLVKDFIQNKFIFFRQPYTFYLFNKLALKLEIIESNGNTDFATTYIENINNYQNAFTKK